jgi:hypothetical protein
MAALFKLSKYRFFDFHPRYYDPVKEERKQKLIDYRESLGKDSNFLNDKDFKPGTTIKGSFKSKMTRTSYRNKNSVVRLIIMAVLLALAYVLMKSDLTSVVNFFK